MIDARGAIDGLKLAAVVLLGVLAYRAITAVRDAAAGALQAVGNAVGQTYADVYSGVANTFSSPPAPSEKAFLYADESYTGIDTHTGLGVLAGARADEEFRRHEYQQRDAGHAPAATSNAGAAFGIYPRSGRRRG